VIGPEFHGGGHPWHGLCTGGSLALPNGTTKVYAQPSGGDCWKIAVPGHVAPTRSAAQQADDTARGYQWLGHGLISGDPEQGLQLYGKSLGKRWIWAVDAGRKWLVDVSGLGVSAGVLSGAITCTEFGMQHPDGAPAAVKTANLSTPAAGLDAAEWIHILDIGMTGDRILLGLAAQARHQYHGRWVEPLPEAVVQLMFGMDGDNVDVSAFVAYDAAWTGVGGETPWGYPPAHLLDVQYTGGVDAVASHFIHTQINATIKTWSSDLPTPAPAGLELWGQGIRSELPSGDLYCEILFIRPTPGGTITFIDDSTASVPDIDAELATLQADIAWLTDPDNWEEYPPDGPCPGGYKEIDLGLTYDDVVDEIPAAGDPYSDYLGDDDQVIEDQLCSGVFTMSKHERYAIDLTWEVIYPIGEVCQHDPHVATYTTGTLMPWILRVRNHVDEHWWGADYYYYDNGPGTSPRYTYKRIKDSHLSSGSFTLYYPNTLRVYTRIGGVQTQLLERGFQVTPYEAQIDGAFYPSDWHADRYTLSAHGVDLAELVYRRPCHGAVMAVINVLDRAHLTAAQPQLYKIMLKDCAETVIDEWDAGTTLAGNWHGTLHPVTREFRLDRQNALCWV
jgi:hypothetical protein